jgi:hypothetical protein
MFFPHRRIPKRPEPDAVNAEELNVPWPWRAPGYNFKAGGKNVISGTAAGGDAYFVSLISPGDLQSDQKYGVVPFTVFVGKGAGAGYLSGGAGPSFTLLETEINLNPWSH